MNKVQQVVEESPGQGTAWVKPENSLLEKQPRLRLKRYIGPDIGVFYIFILKDMTVQT